MSKFDLATLDTAALAEKGAELTLRHPGTKEPLDVIITLAGRDSATYRREESRLADKYRRQKSAGRGPEDFRQDSVDSMAACTLGWNNMTVDGEELPCIRENARKVYSRFPWILEQVQDFVLARENYLQD